MWHYQTLVDQPGMPLWPNGMEQARLVISSELCRTSPHLLPAPFMPPQGIERCGIHVSAKGQNTPVLMSRWMTDFLGWPSTDANRFIDLANSTIYSFRPMASAADIAQHMEKSRLKDLLISSTRLVVAAGQNNNDASWLDQFRIEIRLHRTTEGFVRAAIQILSILHPSVGLTITPLDSNVARLAYLGPTSEHRSFQISITDKNTQSLYVPSSLFTQHDTPNEPAGTTDQTVLHFSSLHPSLHLATHIDPVTASVHENCQLHMLVSLPATYFFDPYQLSEVQHSQMAHSNFTHYGPIELERPAETMDNWGSILHLSTLAVLTNTDIAIPIHARYRLPPIDDSNKVSFNGDPRGNTHIDTVLPPTIVAVGCPPPHLSSDPTDSTNDMKMLLNALTIRPIPFDELGIWPLRALKVSADSELLLRMPVGDASWAPLIQVLTLAALLLGSAYISYTVFNVSTGRKNMNKI